MKKICIVEVFRANVLKLKCSSHQLEWIFTGSWPVVKQQQRYVLLILFNIQILYFQLSGSRHDKLNLHVNSVLYKFTTKSPVAYKLI